MLIRRAIDTDAAAIRSLHQAAIREVCARDYPAAVIAAWADGSSEARFLQRIREQSFWVIVEAQGLLAFGGMDIGKHTIEGLFVAPSALGRGLAARMLAHLERIAIEAGIGQLRLESSLTARGFYEKYGYCAGVGEASLVLASGVEVSGVPMSKWLQADTTNGGS
jgi:GNAT superfamily N-acetyltransferase